MNPVTGKTGGGKEIMKLKTTDLDGVAIDAIEPDEIRPATGADGVLRVVDGAPVYPLRGVMVRDADGQAIKASSVRVRTAPTSPIPALSVVRCVDCVVTPWVRDGRVAISVLADHVEVASAARHQAVNHGE